MKDWQSLSLKEQIAQMIVVRASGHLFDHQIRYPAWEANNRQLKSWLSEFNLGGVILLGGSSVELQARSQQLQSWANIPLFIAADVEEGIGQRFPGGTWFPPPMALGRIYERDPVLAQQYAEQMGEIVAQEALTVGINWLLAPVVDVNNNPDNPAINIRAFGDRPEVVADLTTAFIRGAKSTPVLTTAKHFPGHGDTSTDSHLDLPALHHTESRLAAVELLPFQQAIAAEVDSVMTAHLLIPAWDDKPVTLSTKIVTQILRQRLNFSGLVVTDALIMGGITQYADPKTVAVMAVQAGTDILLMPDDPEVAIAAIYDGVQTGKIKESRIQESLSRIWQSKKQIFNTSIEHTELSSDKPNGMASLRAKFTVSSVLKNSLQYNQNSQTKVIAERINGRNLIVVDDVLNTAYLDINSPAITIPQKYNYQRQLIDCHTLDCILLDERPTLLQIFIRGNPFRGSAGLTEQTKAIYRQLLGSQKAVGIAIYGSPYVLDWFKTIMDSDLPWVFSYGQMEQSQTIALGSLFTDNSWTSGLESNDFGF